MVLSFSWAFSCFILKASPCVFCFTLHFMSLSVSHMFSLCIYLFIYLSPCSSFIFCQFICFSPRVSSSFPVPCAGSWVNSVFLLLFPVASVFILSLCIFLFFVVGFSLAWFYSLPFCYQTFCCLRLDFWMLTLLIKLTCSCIRVVFCKNMTYWTDAEEYTLCNVFAFVNQFLPYIPKLLKYDIIVSSLTKLNEGWKLCKERRNRPILSAQIIRNTATENSVFICIDSD